MKDFLTRYERLGKNKRYKKFLTDLLIWIILTGLIYLSLIELTDQIIKGAL